MARLGDLVNGLDNYYKTLDLTSGKEHAIILRTLGGIYGDKGFVEKAKSMFNEALMLDGDSASHIIRLGYLETALGNLEVSFEIAQEV